jgi:hypothetical protein
VAHGLLFEGLSPRVRPPRALARHGLQAVASHVLGFAGSKATALMFGQQNTVTFSTILVRIP